MVSLIQPNAVSYPGFGTAVGNPEAYSSLQKIFVRAVVATPAATAAVCFSLCTVVPVLLPVAIGAAAVLLALCLLFLYAHYTQHQRKIAFPELDTEHPHNPAFPALGQWHLGDDVIVSNSVEETFLMKKQIIQSARKSIEISFNFGGGNVFRETLQLINAQMQRRPELKVHLIISEDLLESDDIKMLKNIGERFGNRFNYLICSRHFGLLPYPYSQENHAKLMVVDGKYFSVGGSGIHDKMVFETQPQNLDMSRQTYSSMVMENTFRDTDVVGKGNIAGLMREQFFRLYYACEYHTNGTSSYRYFETDGLETSCTPIDTSERLIQNTKMKYIVSGPEHYFANPIVSEMVERVRQSRRKIKFGTLVFNPPKQLASALKAKKEEGVKIVGVFNGGNSTPFFSNAIHVWPSRPNYHLLTRAYEYRKPDQLYHKKVAVFDDTYAKIGSEHESEKSRYRDYENAVFFEDPRVCAAVKAGLTEDQARCNRLAGPSLEAIQHSLWHRIKGAIIYPFASMMG